MKQLILGLTLSVITFSGCAQEKKQSNNTNHSIENTQELKGIKRVSKAYFKAYLDNHANAQLIDVRTPQEFQSGNIEGAKNINVNDSNFEETINNLDKNIPVLIYCKSGGRSARALKIFEANGFTTVLELEGGYSNW